MKAKANTKRRCLFGAKIKNYKHMGSITLKWDKIKGYTANGLKSTLRFVYANWLLDLRYTANGLKTTP